MLVSGPGGKLCAAPFSASPYIQPSHQFLAALSSDYLLNLVALHPSIAALGISLPASSFVSLQSVLFGPGTTFGGKKWTTPVLWIFQDCILQDKIKIPYRDLTTNLISYHFSLKLYWIIYTFYKLSYFGYTGAQCSMPFLLQPCDILLPFSIKAWVTPQRTAAAVEKEQQLLLKAHCSLYSFPL